MILGSLLLLRPSSLKFPQNSYYQPVIGNPTTPSQFYLKDVAWAGLELIHLGLISGEQLGLIPVTNSPANGIS